MAKKEAKKEQGAPVRKNICQNRRALRDYQIDDRFEAGLVLTGSEAKSCREGQPHLNDAYVLVRGGEAFLIGGYIPEYRKAIAFGHEPTRTRKLLLHAKELHKLAVRQQERGEAIVPLSMYFKDGWVKLEIGVGKGKTHLDRRDTIKERESRREVERALRRRR